MASDATARALISCPVCDALYTEPDVDGGHVARCGRCGFQLASGKRNAIVRVVAIAVASLVLMGIVVFAPFLVLKSSGFGSMASVFDVAFAFDSARMFPLAIGVLVFVLGLPLLRLLLLIYALAPATVNRAPFAHAPDALRLALWLRPWAMAEIFMVGVAVALIKLADLATLFFGPAFWAFTLVVLLNAYKDSQMSRSVLWAAVTR